MSEQLSKDPLAYMKFASAEMIRTDGGMSAHKRFIGSLDARRVLALIECAEIVQTDYLLLSDEQRMKALRVLKELGV